MTQGVFWGKASFSRIRSSNYTVSIVPAHLFRIAQCGMIARVITLPHQGVTMFEKPRYIQSSFSVVFPRQITIRRRSNDFENILQSKYGQPQIINVQDDTAPEIPRIIFMSKFNQIAISQVNITLNVTFSQDWQNDIMKGRNHLQKHMPFVFKLLNTIQGVEPYFCGFTTVVHMRSDMDDDSILRYISEKLLKKMPIDKLHDVEIKNTKIISDHFFSNITIGNYRLLQLDAENVTPIPDRNAIDRGVQILGDFNDRYAFNEAENYHSSKEVAVDIINNGVSALEHEIEEFERVDT